MSTGRQVGTNVSQVCSASTIRVKQPNRLP